MVQNKDTGKIAKTRNKISKAFLPLYAERPLQQISIKALTTAAGINRGTFYLHYQDLNELVTAIENEQIEALAYLSRNADTLRYPPTGTDELAQFFLPIVRYIQSQEDLFRVLLSAHARPNFREAVYQLVKRNLIRRFQSVLSTAGGKELAKKECIVEYILSANINVIAYWVQSGITITPEELTDLLSNISIKGPFQAIGI